MSKASLPLFISASVMLLCSYSSYGQQVQSPRSTRQTQTDAAEEGRQRNQQVGHERVAAVSGRWRRVTSPQGRFSVELPEGWEIRQNQTQGDPQLVAQENIVTFGPVGQIYPGVGVMGWITVTVWQALGTGIQDPEINRLMCQQVSAQKFYSQIFVPLLRRAMPDLKIERMSPSQPSALARVEGSLSHQGQPYQALAIISMEYLSDPTLSLTLKCPQPWVSIPFVGDLIASPREFPSLVPVAERIFSTFRPNSRWGEEAMTQIFQAMETRMAIIGRTVSRVTKMETQQRMQEIQSFRRTSQRWVDTVGGVYRYGDPKDPSYQGTIPGSKIPSGPTRWWGCGSQPPIAADRSPGYGCREVPPPY